MKNNLLIMQTCFKNVNNRSFFKTICVLSIFSIHFNATSQTIKPGDEVANWNFSSSNIILNNSVITVKDESGSNYTGTLMNDAKIRTIGSSTTYNVLDLANGNGYFDMGAEIGKAVYLLSNYTMSAFYRVNATNTDLDKTGNCLWNFSNSADVSTDKNGYIYGSLRNQNQHITPGYWATSEQYVGSEEYPPNVAAKNGWHHMAYTQNGNIGTLYIDGLKTSTGTVTNLPSKVLPKTGLTGTPFNWIGRSCYPGDVYLKKTLVYGFSLYKVALTADDMIHYLNVPAVISELNTAYAQDSDANPLNLAPVDAGIITGNETVCQGQNTVIYSVPSIKYSTSYIWTIPTGATGSSSTNSITVNYAKTFTSGNITVHGHNICGDGTPSTMAVTSHPLPGDAGNISGNMSVCQGEEAVSYSVPVIENATSYSWELSAGITGTSTTNTITVSFSKNAVSGSISVKGHNDCGDGLASSHEITVNQLPDISINDTATISGRLVPLLAIINYTGSGSLKYKWTPSTGLNSDTIACPVANVSKKTTYTLTVTTPAGCAVSKDVTVRISAMDPPVIGIVSVSSSNKNLIVWNKPVSTGIESYSVYKETSVSDVFEKIGTVPYDSLSIFVDNQSSPDQKSNKYKLSVTDLNGVESELSNPHKTMHLSINKGMNNTWNLIWEPYIGFNVSTYNIYRGSSPDKMSFIDATSGGSTQYSDQLVPTSDVYYQMEVISPVLVKPSKTPAIIQKSIISSNSFASTLLSYSSSRSNIATNVISGINDLTGDNNKIKIYPNPVKDELRIDYDGSSSYEISNLMGQIIYNGNLIDSNIVYTSNLSTGVYIIKFKQGNSIEIKKFIKE